MIYVKRNPKMIPDKLLKVAGRAQATLEGLPANERVAFIKKKAHIWRAFKNCLREMSYGKCWYSESKDPQSFFDVDHFRPKSEAKRSTTETDDGYPWLAFDWDNFRYSAGRSNRLSKDEETRKTQGKSSWFPLIEGSPIACWDDRCIGDEKPMLLDPVNPNDMKLVVVGSDGRVQPTRTCKGTAKSRVLQTIKAYGLNLTNLKEARQDAMREVIEQVDQLMKCLEAADMADIVVADALPIEDQCKAITARALPNKPYSLAAYAQLAKSFPDLLPKEADYEAMAA